MKTIAFISGKGGTGKTSLVATFAKLAAPMRLADCDVDAANLGLLLGPSRTLLKELFLSGQRAVIVQDTCITCGVCQEYCRFKAISSQDGVFLVDHLRCEGCGICRLVCPLEAIDLLPNEAGSIRKTQIAEGVFIQGELHPAQSNSGKLVSRVRDLANEPELQGNHVYLLLDGPPGVGCSVHATLARANLVVIVTEPTPSGEHDLSRAIELVEHFRLQGSVIVNKSDLNEKLSDRIVALSLSRGVPVLGQLPFVHRAPRELARRNSLLELKELRPRLELIWKGIVVAVEESVANDHVQARA